MTEKTSELLTGWLYYIEYADKACKIRQFKLSSGESRALYVPKKCPDKLVAPDRNRILFIFRNHIQEIHLGPQVTEGPEISFPEPKTKPNSSDAVFSDAGYINGILSIVMTSIYPWDDQDAYLYQHKHGKWLMLQEKHCHRLDWCGYMEFYPRPVNAFFWGNELMPWHRKQDKNPYLAGKKSTTNREGEEIVTITEMLFRFKNNQSTLLLSTQEGQDSDVTLIMGIKLKTSEGNNKIICPNQCSASLTGKYLLVKVFWSDDPYQLYDLETGKVIKYIYTFRWVYE